MKILSKYSYWWKKEEKEWATQDKDGNWWVYKNENKSPNMKIINKRRKGQTSNVLKGDHYLIIALASALGVSLALNILSILS